MSSTGLVCPKCGTNLSDVVATRATEKSITRKRRCFNGHPFPTVEKVVNPGKGVRQKVEARAKKLLAEGLSHRAVADRLRCSAETIRRIDNDAPSRGKS